MHTNLDVQALIDYHTGRAKSYDNARKRICWRRNNQIEFSKRENKKLEHEMNKLTRKYHMHMDTVAILQEKAEREKRMQWLNDIDNPLEPIKIQAALDSELLKYQYRKEHQPQNISPLDLTIIYALQMALANSLEESK